MRKKSKRFFVVLDSEIYQIIEKAACETVVQVRKIPLWIIKFISIQQ